MPTAASGAALANSNGKRPHGTISNGDEATTAPGLPTGGARRGEFAPKTHTASGYTWDRAEDEPGYSWLNKKAQDEFQRGLEGLVHVNSMIRGTYGDPIEVAERERAGLAAGK